MIRRLDLEILIIPAAVSVAVSVLTPRRVGWLGAVPIAVFAAGIALIPLLVRIIWGPEREHRMEYVTVNLGIAVVIALAIWAVRTQILGMFRG